MAKVLIISIGTGPGVEHGIATSISQTHPDNILFLATKDSTDTIPKVQQELGKSFPHDQVILEDANDVERCYQNSNDLKKEKTIRIIKRYFRPKKEWQRHKLWIREV